MSKQVVTVRLEEDLVDELDQEADEQGCNRTEYIRSLLRNREEYTENTGRNQTEYDRIQERLNRLEAAVFGENTSDYEAAPREDSPATERNTPTEPGPSVEDDVDTGVAAARQAVQELEWPAGPRAGEERAREAVMAVVEYIHREDGAGKSEILEEVYPDHRAEFDKPENWWVNFVIQRLQELRDEHGVVRDTGGGRFTEWEIGAPE